MIKKCTLDNKVRIVTEEINHVNSTTIGIWVKAGSRCEETSNNGVSHFIEHMMFKGTKKRTAKQIANTIDKIGGQMNAFTAKECTCYYIKSLDAHFDISLDVLADMFFESNFDELEINKEKGVVLEEINMYEDSPEDQVHDIFIQNVYKNNPLGMPILGNVDTVGAFTRESILNYFNQQYIPEHVVISVVGNITHEQAVEKVKVYFEKLQVRDTAHQLVTPEYHKSFAIKRKETEQVHLCIGYNGIGQSNEHIYTLHVLSNIFGGSMSSRLFQTIREDNGLAYSVFAYSSIYQDTGLFTIYAGMKPTQLERVIELAMGEVKRIVKDGITEEELFDSKEQLKGSYMLGLESTSSRMMSIGRTELLQDKVMEPKETIKKIDEVTMESINHMIKTIFESELSAVAIGKIDEKIDLQELIYKYR